MPEDKEKDEQENVSTAVCTDQGMDDEDNTSTYVPGDQEMDDEDNGSTDTEEIMKRINEPHEDAVKRLLGVAKYKMKQSKLPFKNRKDSPKEMPEMLKAISKEISPTKKYNAKHSKKASKSGTNRK